LVRNDEIDTALRILGEGLAASLPGADGSQ
jgi:hypothetical protein